MKFMVLVNRGSPAPGAKATGQTQRWDESDSDYSGSRGREEGAKVTTALLFSP